MAMKITDTQMTSDQTRHTAAVVPGAVIEAGPTAWGVSWLPGRLLLRNQAITAMTIAEVVATHKFQVDGGNDPIWLHIDSWAAELGITGPHAVAEASLSPEDHDAALRVQVILPEPGPVGYLYSLDRATGKATVRFDGVTVTMDACRLQYCGTGAALAAGDEQQRADEDGGSVFAAAVVAEPDGGPLELTGAERSDVLTVMTEHEAKVLLAYIAGCAPKVFDKALTTRPWSLADQLFARIEERDQSEYMAEPDGYCTVCGANASWFLGFEGPQHFRGPHKLVTGAERRELFTPEDGHAPQVAWRQSGGAS